MILYDCCKTYRKKCYWLFSDFRINPTLPKVIYLLNYFITIGTISKNHDSIASLRQEPKIALPSFLLTTMTQKGVAINLSVYRIAYCALTCCFFIGRFH